MRRPCLLLALCFASARSAWTATYYVATTGNDANPGTSAAPWKSVAKAVNTMVAGDTTYVRGGTYNEGLITFKRSGTQAAPIKLLNAPGESPVIDFGVNYDHTKVQRFQFQAATGYNTPIGWITLEGFEMKNGYDGIKYYNLHDSVIARNTIHHHSSQGIKGNGSLRVTIDRNIIHSNGDFELCASTPAKCNLLHGIYIDGNYVTITNNVIYNNLAMGIVQNGDSAYSSTGHAGPEYSGASNWFIANNTFAYQAYRGAISVWGNRCRDTRIENNIFYENCQRAAGKCGNVNGIHINSGVSGISIRNNIAYASGSGGLLFFTPGLTEGVQYTQSGNIVNVSNPAFVNGGNNALPASPDFRLTAQSPAINRGLNLYGDGVRTDLIGVARPQTGSFEVGAYEYGGSTPPPTNNLAPAKPRGFRLQ
ncbi:MAG: right-handed parallel beta-helix repeat-containing protein [Elusimicrobiota bacterium]